MRDARDDIATLTNYSAHRLDLNRDIVLLSSASKPNISATLAEAARNFIFCCRTLPLRQGVSLYVRLCHIISDFDSLYYYATTAFTASLIYFLQSP
jgi:hypothetical protein